MKHNGFSSRRMLCQTILEEKEEQIDYSFAYYKNIKKNY
jgi:hypothetical protein